MALPDIAWLLRDSSSHHLISGGFQHYSPHILLPHGVVALGHLWDVAIHALEGFGRHCAGKLCFQGFGDLLRAGERCFRAFGSLSQGGRTEFTRFRKSY
jgi:hypothetical protein